MKLSKILILAVLAIALTGCANSINQLPSTDHIKDIKDNIKQNQQNNQDEEASATAEWLTYNNSLYQYSIQYPNEWFVDTKYSEDGFTQRGHVEDNTFMGGDTIWSNYQNTTQYNPGTAPEDLQQVFLLIKKVDPQITVSEYFNSINYSYTNFENITINGLDAILINLTGEGVGPNPIRVYLIKSGDKIFKFSHGLDQIEAKTILETMINTFTLN